MSSRQEIVATLTAYYKEIIKQPGIDDNALKTAPPEGWNHIDEEKLRQYGKNETVIDLLKHLPYLESDHGDLGRVMVGYGTYAMDYRQSASNTDDDLNPIPGHCVYISTAHDYNGYARILDTQRGTISNFHLEGGNNPREATQYSDPNDPEEWKRARTLPVADFCSIWTRRLQRLVDMLAPDKRDVDFITRGSRLDDDSGHDDMPLEPIDVDQDTEMEDDGNNADTVRAIYTRHGQNVYNCYLRHGWPANFDKQSCRRELLQEHDRFDRELKDELNKGNPEAGLFDD